MAAKKADAAVTVQWAHPRWADAAVTEARKVDAAVMEDAKRTHLNQQKLLHLRQPLLQNKKANRITGSSRNTPMRIRHEKTS